MSKELEALSQIEKHVNCYKKDKEDYKEHFETLRKALTPPTAEEVCKALGGWIDENNMIETDEVYYDEKKMSFEVGQYKSSICFKDGDVIWFNWFKLPPHLITLIGRFYESVVK